MDSGIETTFRVIKPFTQRVETDLLIHRIWKVLVYQMIER